MIALEPGLYRHGYAGVRLEDLVLVTEDGAEVLTSFPYDFELLSDQTIETIFTEDRRYPPPPDFAAQAVAQPDIYEREFEEFWESEGRERVTWFEPFTKLYEWELPYAKWYLGGKLNVSYNCVDRHVEAGLGDRVAYLWEGEPEGDRREITYAQLQSRGRPLRERAQGARRRQGNEGRDLHGHGPGAADRDARVHAPRRAAHRRLRRLLGRLALRPRERHGLRDPDHAGRGVAARHDRAAEADRRRGDGRRTRDPARASSSAAPATTCRCRTGATSGCTTSTSPTTRPPARREPMDAEDLLFLMYTSGTTAKPKGIAHTTAGYLVGVASTHALIFDLKPEQDVYWCAADIGWITGHSYIVYGPL